MIVPRPFCPDRGPGYFSLSEPLSHSLQLWSEAFASSAGGPGPVSLSATSMRTSILPQHSLTERRFRFPGHASTPQQSNLSHFGPFLAPGTSQNSGQKSPSPAASTGGRRGQYGTPQEKTRRSPKHPAP